jgi:hypothetical protein
MKPDFRNISYNGTNEPFIRRISYIEGQKLYSLFRQRISFSAGRMSPLRHKLSQDEKQRFMDAMFGVKISTADDTGKAMFDVLSTEDIQIYKKAKDRHTRLLEEMTDRNDALMKMSGNWHKNDILALAKAKGADIAGLVSYYDPVFRSEMVSLIFGLSMRGVLKLPLPSLEADAYAFKANSDLQNITSDITQTLWARDIFCYPVPCATYFGWENIEFNQVRFLEGAFDGCMGKCFMFVTKELGPMVRVGQVLLKHVENLELEKPKHIDFCKDCNRCVEACPSKALKVDDAIVCSRYFFAHERCSICMASCPVGLHE